MARLTIPQYVMALAHVAALRSEDPYRKVGAAALDADNRVIGTAYNGLFPKFTAPSGFWDSRDERQKYMLHAEINFVNSRNAKIVFIKIFFQLMSLDEHSCSPWQSLAEQPATAWYMRSADCCR